MRSVLAALCALVISVSFASAAQAQESRAFPPDDCSVTAPFMAFTGAANTNTKCLDGQALLTIALPQCGDDQVVAKVGGVFTCQPLAVLPKPCTAGQVLSYIANKGYQCVTLASAINVACPSGQVLAGIQNGQPTCVPLTSGGTTATAAEPAGCELDTLSITNSQFMSGQTLVGHTNKGGGLIEAGVYAMYSPVKSSSQIVPSGWQDSQGAAGGNIASIGSNPYGTCTPATNYSGGYSCYTCIDGTWSKYWDYAAPN